jgi:mycoredoxin
MVDHPNTIKLFGTSWCGDTRRARRFLDENQIGYEWVDIDQDKEAASFVEKTNNGFRSVPTILFPDGSILVEPSIMELRTKLEID